jgi:hypothetical protein
MGSENNSSQVVLKSLTFAHFRLNAKAKRELETLRQRFNLIQKSGALERSPSASESELSMEVSQTCVGGRGMYITLPKLGILV